MLRPGVDVGEGLVGETKLGAAVAKSLPHRGELLGELPRGHVATVDPPSVDAVPDERSQGGEGVFVG